jgi:hypothetical protein
MKNNIFLAAIVLFLLLGSGMSQENSAAFVWRKETNNVWGPGEKLDFGVKWQFITVGYATMEVREPEDVNGRKAYHIYTEARTAPFFDNFYKVRDTNESWIDTESLCSLKFVSNVNESKHVKMDTEIYDQENGKFSLVEQNKSGTIPAWVQDILSSLYYLRTKELTVGEAISIDTHSGKDSWPLVIKVVKRERITVPAGEFNCVLVEPAIREGTGIFESRGKLWVWLTDDARKVPVKMSSKIPIGSVQAVLTGMHLSK